MQLDFKIDKLTHSLEDVATGETFYSEIAPFLEADLRLVSKKSGWKFNWKKEFLVSEKQIYKLILQKQPEIIQGLICFEKRSDHIFMSLIETAPHNFGRTKKFFGVAGNLVAFGCKLSFECGFEGYIAFESKTKLIGHYSKTLGAKLLFGQHMELDTNASMKLINRYFPDFFNKYD